MCVKTRQTPLTLSVREKTGEHQETANRGERERITQIMRGEERQVGRGEERKGEER